MTLMCHENQSTICLKMVRLGFRDEWPACALGCLFGQGNAIQFGIGLEVALSSRVVLARKVELQADAWP
jgi:hypothetical protein